MSKVVIVHGWGGTPKEGWFPWLQNELERRGHDVIVPQLPETHTPHVPAWVTALAESVGEVDASTYFVGHSMGCQTIIRFLETLPVETVAGGAVFVAGFFSHITGLTEKSDLLIDMEWYQSAIDTDTVRKRLRRSVALFSDNDPYVPVENVKEFQKRMGSEAIVLTNQGHFNESAGFRELPIALERLLEIME